MPCRVVLLLTCISIFCLQCATCLSFQPLRVPNLVAPHQLQLKPSSQKFAFGYQNLHEQIYEIYALNTTSKSWLSEFAIREGNGSSISWNSDGGEFAIASPYQSKFNFSSLTSENGVRLLTSSLGSVAIYKMTDSSWSLVQRIRLSDQVR
jgi:hypothetical protein